MSGYDVIERVKEKAGFNSDNALAQRMEIDRRIINNLKRTGGDPSARLLVELMKVGNLSTEETEKLLRKERGFIEMSLLAVTAIAALPLTQAILWLKDCILC